MRKRGYVKCSVDECDANLYARTYCRNHYERNRKTGSPVAEAPKPYVECAFEGCTNMQAGRNPLCSGHYMQVWQGRELKPLRRTKAHPIINGTRQCWACEQVKPLSDYYLKKTGYRGCCKRCEIDKAIARRAGSQ